MGSNTETGDEFETQVADLLISGGYTVKQKISIEGFEFDLIATKPSDFGQPYTIAIECKYVEKARVSNAAVINFLNAFDNARRSHHFDRGLVISKNGFSRSAHAAVQKFPSVALQTLRELHSSLFGITSYLNGTTKEIDKDIENSPFIYPSGVRRELRQPIPDMKTFLEERLVAEDPFFAFVTADFGAGKTTLLRQVFKSLAQSFLAGQTERVPFLFPLKTLTKHDSVQDFIEYQVSRHSINATYDLFERYRADSRLVILLDGFDEISSHALRNERLSYFRDALRIAQGSDKLIISSRPSYFEGVREINSLIDHIIDRDYSAPFEIPTERRATDLLRNEQVRKLTADLTAGLLGAPLEKFRQKNSARISIDPFDEEKILSYLECYSEQLTSIQGYNAEETLEKVKEVYDLSDLITRPIILSILVNVLVSGQIKLSDSGLTLGAAGLYSVYVNFHVQNDWSRGDVRQYLSKEERLSFSRALALASVTQPGMLEASYDAIITSMEEFFGSDGHHNTRGFLEKEPLRVITDIRTCTFIKVDAHRKIYFIHKSFAEFFVAEHVATELDDGGTSDILKLPLGYEVLYFLGSFNLLRSAILENLRRCAKEARNSSEPVLLSNCHVAMMFAGEVSTSEVFEATRFSSLRMKKKSFQVCEFSDFHFSKVFLGNIGFRSCSFEATSISGTLETVVFERCTGSLTLEGSATAVEFNCAMSVKLLNADWEDVLCSGASFDFDGSIVRNGQFSDCGASFDSNSRNRTEFKGCEFSRSRFTTRGESNAAGLVFLKAPIKFDRHCTFNEVSFEGTNVEWAGLRLAIEAGNLEHCQGLIVASGIRRFYRSGAREEDEPIQDKATRVGDLLVVGSGLDPSEYAACRDHTLKKRVRNDELEKFLGDLNAGLFVDAAKSG